MHVKQEKVYFVDISLFPFFLPLSFPKSLKGVFGEFVPFYL